jgi:hypothetical protein
MSRGIWRVKPSEIARAIKSVQATGLPVRNVEIVSDGMVRINIGGLDKAAHGLDEKTSEDLRKLL